MGCSKSSDKPAAANPPVPFSSQDDENNESKIKKPVRVKVSTGKEKAVPDIESESTPVTEQPPVVVPEEMSVLVSQPEPVVEPQQEPVVQIQAEPATNSQQEPPAGDAQPDRNDGFDAADSEERPKVSLPLMSFEGDLLLRRTNSAQTLFKDIAHTKNVSGKIHKKDFVDYLKQHGASPRKARQYYSKFDSGSNGITFKTFFDKVFDVTEDGTVGEGGVHGTDEKNQSGRASPRYSGRVSPRASGNVSPRSSRKVSQRSWGNISSGKDAPMSGESTKVAQKSEQAENATLVSDQNPSPMTEQEVLSGDIQSDPEAKSRDMQIVEEAKTGDTQVEDNKQVQPDDKNLNSENVDAGADTPTEASKLTTAAVDDTEVVEQPEQSTLPSAE